MYFSPPHSSLNPSRPVMSLTVFSGKDGGVREVKERGVEKKRARGMFLAMVGTGRGLQPLSPAFLFDLCFGLERKQGLDLR